LTIEFPESFDSRALAALSELQALILRSYPDAQFEVCRGHDDPEALLLVTTVDIDDPDDVVDLVIDRMMEIQIERGLPLYVVPIRSPARVMALIRARSLA
jgi:hypothetical protein